MSQILTVNLNKPIISAKFMDDDTGDVVSEMTGSGHAGVQADTEHVSVHDRDLDDQKAAFSQACQALNGVIAGLNQFYDELYVGHREEIVRLSVEIARKILMKKVENGDYEIESIVKEALNNKPANQDVVVHLNPDDIEKCRNAQQSEPDSILAGIKLVPDPNIGRAECLLESPKGIIKSLINDSLERIGKALEKVN